MPSILFYPIIPFTFVAMLVVYWLAVTALIYTSGEALQMHTVALQSHYGHTTVAQIFM